MSIYVTVRRSCQQDIYVKESELLELGSKSIILRWSIGGTLEIINFGYSNSSMLQRWPRRRELVVVTKNVCSTVRRKGGTRNFPGHRLAGSGVKGIT